VRALTGIDTDRLPEEKARGISIDLGFAHWQSEEFDFGVVDVPGHERFIRNMVAGATGVDLVLLVVAADDSVMPQTIEHLEIMDLLGVSAGVICVTKVDLVDREFVELVRAETIERVKGTFLEKAPVVAVSAQTGEGLGQLRSVLASVARTTRWPERGELFRMPIDRVFSIPGHGTVVTGTVLGGEVRAGDMLELLPRQQPLRVRGVQSHGRQLDQGGARRRTAINLAGIKGDGITRGEELASAGWLRPSRRLLVSLCCLKSSPIELRDRQQLNAHLGTREVSVRLALKGGAVSPGSRGYGELRASEDVVAAWGQRFILRRPSPPLTIAGGLILDPAFTPGRTRVDLAEHGRILESGDELARVSRWLASLDQVPADGLEAFSKTGITPSRYVELLTGLEKRGLLVRTLGRGGHRLVHVERLGQLSAAVLKRVAAEIKRHQPRRTLPRSALTAACQNLASSELLEAAFENLLRTGQLVASGANLGPAAAQTQLSKNQLAVKASMVERVTQGGLMPPTLSELAVSLGQKPELVTALAGLCVEDGLFIEVSDNLYHTPRALEQARQICRAKLAELGSATMSQLREAWQITRKYSVPLCEFFDQRQLTIRQGDLRRAGPNLDQPIAES
jgi:selenocysteine-specific elongation factor